MDFRQRLRVVTFFALQIYDFGMTARRVTPVGENLNSPNLSGYLYVILVVKVGCVKQKSNGRVHIKRDCTFITRYLKT